MRTNIACSQETIMSWNTNAVWNHGIKTALLLMITPTFKCLTPRFSWTHLISLTDGSIYASNAVRWVRCDLNGMHRPIICCYGETAQGLPTCILLCTCWTQIKYKKAKTSCTQRVKKQKLESYRHYTEVLQMSSWCSHSWSPPTAGDTLPGWHKSPLGM